MAANVAKQNNKIYYASYRFPYDLARRGMPGKIGRVISVIYSYSNNRSKSKAECVLTYRGLAACACVSPATVARAINTMRSIDGFTEREENGRKRYSIHTSGGCIRRYRYLFEHTFEMANGNRKLTSVEESILDIILSHVTNPNARNGFEGSERRFATLLGRSTDTIGNAIRSLMSAGLLHRPRRGTSRHRLSRYTVCRELRRIVLREDTDTPIEKTQQGFSTQRDRDQDARTEFERHFAMLRDQAIAAADAARARAERDADFTKIEHDLRSLTPTMARADVRGDRKTLRDLMQKKRALTMQRTHILARIGLSIEDLMPQWHCKICDDTGFRKSDGHMCSCWRLPKRQD